MFHRVVRAAPRQSKASAAEARMPGGHADSRTELLSSSTLDHDMSSATKDNHSNIALPLLRHQALAAAHPSASDGAAAPTGDAAALALASASTLAGGSITPSSAVGAIDAATAQLLAVALAAPDSLDEELDPHGYELE